MSIDSEINVHKLVNAIIPEMVPNGQKGEYGRIGVIGGSREYTGAPYFSAISALKTGADLIYVFSTKDAASVIKTYSPELIVFPGPGEEIDVDEVINHLSRFNSVVIGPGLGRSDMLPDILDQIIKRIRDLDIPLVLDADALYFVCKNPKLVHGYEKALLTPNAREFDHLYAAMFEDVKPSAKHEDAISELCKKLGGVTILRKGGSDIVSNGKYVLTSPEEGSPRRCGGQGDLLSGALATFAHWSHMADAKHMQPYGANLIACLGASMLTRRCSKLAFNQLGRSSTVTDMIALIHTAFSQLFK